MTNQEQKARILRGEEGCGDRRTRIVEAASRLLAEEGYDRVTMKQVAREAGVAQGLIYYYLSGKDEILLEVLRAGRGDVSPSPCGCGGTAKASRTSTSSGAGADTTSTPSSS